MRVGGKLIRPSLTTDVLALAQMRMNDLVREERRLLEARANTSRGKMAFGEVLALYLERLEANPTLKSTASDPFRLESAGRQP